MVESHMRARRQPRRIRLLPSSTPWQPSPGSSYPFSLLSSLPSPYHRVRGPRYPFCLCKARASKVVSSAFGRLIALAYSTKFGRAVPLSGTTQEFSDPRPSLRADRQRSSHPFKCTLNAVPFRTPLHMAYYRRTALPSESFEGLSRDYDRLLSNSVMQSANNGSWYPAVRQLTHYSDLFPRFDIYKLRVQNT